MGKRLLILLGLSLVFVVLLAPLDKGGATLYSDYSEAEDLVLIRTVGIDTTENGVMITASTGVGLDQSSPQVFKQEGETLSRALDSLRSEPTGRDTFFAHTDHILIGEDAARQGLSGYLDYIARATDMRLVTNIFVVKGGTAQDLMTGVMSQSEDVTQMLETMKEDVQKISDGYVFNCEEVMTGLEKNSCALIMAVQAAENDNLSEGSGEKMVEAAGFAVIDRDKLVDFADPEAAHGAVVLMGKLKADNVPVEDGHEGMASMRLTGAKAGFKPVYNKSGSLERVDIDIKVNANISELQSWMDVIGDSARETLARQTSKVIARRVRAAIDQSQSLGLDYMNLGWNTEVKAPVKFSRWGGWQSEFSKVRFRLKVSTTIRRTFDIGMPLEIGRKKQ